MNIKLENILNKAMQAEEGEDPEKAAKLFEQALKEKPADAYPYERLMIIYRKLKLYKDELRIINMGIRDFRAINKQRQQRSVGRNTKIAQLSNALLKASGLTDKKGNLLFEPGPIAKWEKRKAVVEKKIKSPKTH